MQNVFGWNLCSPDNCSCCCLRAKQGKREKQEELKESLNKGEYNQDLLTSVLQPDSGKEQEEKD